MAKRVDPSVTWAAYREAHLALRAWMESVPEPAWRESSVLPGWTVADLVAHMGTVSGSVTAVEVAPRGVAAATLGAYVGGYAGSAEDIATHAREIVAGVGRRAEAILASVDERFRAATAAFEKLGPQDPVVVAPRGPIRLGEYVVTRVIEIVVHADDLARSVPSVEPPRIPRSAERLAVRGMLDILTERAPGRTVEVRVPPYAAVQCVEGPRHTRGTPPNVVEMAATTWIRLAAGRAAWSTEVGAARVSASGERADLSSLLPLL